LKIFFAAVLSVSTIASAAYAQNCRACNDPNGRGTRVTANFQISVPVSSGASAAEMTTALAQANQSLYEIINRQCETIAVALKGDCRVVQLNVNGNINERFNAVQMVNANANATFQVDSPATAGDGSAAKDKPAAKDAPAH
jgi:hypothetical protein